MNLMNTSYRTVLVRYSTIADGTLYKKLAEFFASTNIRTYFARYLLTVCIFRQKTDFDRVFYGLEENIR